MDGDGSDLSRKEARASTVARLEGGVVVSAQTHRPGGPLDDPDTLVRLAIAAELGGARGFRVAGPGVVELLRVRTALPIIGITKRLDLGHEVFITPTVADAVSLIDAGADIIAADASPQGRPADAFADIVAACHRRGVAVVADCATVEQGLTVAAGQEAPDMVATTMAGYTAETRSVTPPDLGMTAVLAAQLSVPVITEGGIWDPGGVEAAFAAGAYAVVVGSAVTDPERITRRMTGATRDATGPSSHRS
ncbi:putative N-acetylmannosamine-6-phosphate 2-epimerase [Nonomuraea sp. NPDC049784]|uniref:putative N-acetylmannosamine-6-phosphate 2-epimerase n=1 Tax=Nonomuraea sp. NPDC049784 TaxID=3154361 RepID=UPI0033DCDF53